MNSCGTPKSDFQASLTYHDQRRTRLHYIRRGDTGTNFTLPLLVRIAMTEIYNHLQLVRLFGYCLNFPALLTRVQGWRSGESTVVRALDSHQCGPGSIPRLGVICGLSLLVLFSAPRGFSPASPVFTSPQKLTFDVILALLVDFSLHCSPN